MVLQRRAVVGFLDGGAAVPPVITPGRDLKWPTLEWLVLEKYARHAGRRRRDHKQVCRVGDKRYLNAHIRRTGKEVLTLLRVGEDLEVSADGPELNAWVAFDLDPKFAEAAAAIRGDP